MDVLLENGDIVCGRDGTPVMIGGARELAQRAAIRLAVRRGSLPHDPCSAASCTACPPQADRRRATSAPSRMRGAHWRRCRRRAWPQREANGMRKTAAWRCA